ncbi:galanin receptor 2a-like [Amphiura filiformis]|uniref:galanin receptor 2a-like n=1 Tax=Amphiura filiformis TaxID=82378 RepID=UPI003B210703
MASLHLNETVDKNTTLPNIYLVPVPWDWRLFIQLILAIVGIIGNSIVIHVYLHTRTLTMSATNRFIAALAVADIISSICIIPIPTLSYVPDNFGGRFYCKVVQFSFLLWISIIASIFTLTFLAIERFVAIANIRSIQLLKVQAQMFTTKSNKKPANLALLEARQRVIYMLLSVIISFIICWSPDQFAFLAFNLGLVPFEYVYSNLYSAFVILAFANSCLNPVLYALTNKNFRQAIQQHLFCCSIRAEEPVIVLFDTLDEPGELSGSHTEGRKLSVVKSMPPSTSVSTNHFDVAITNNI